MKTSKVEIRQVEGEKGIYTEILIDGHKLEGVRSFELKQGIGDCVPILSIDLNALNLSTDLQMLQVNQKGIGEIEGIKFKGSPRMLKFQAEYFREPNRIILKLLKWNIVSDLNNIQFCLHNYT